VRRADRLFRLLLELRRGRIVTARRLAERLEVSERTVYRLVSDLSSAGVPIEGEAGVGYRLKDFDLPPLMFEREEVEAMVLGARMVESAGDGELARAAGRALAKIESVLPRERSHLVAETRIYVPARGEPPAERLPLSALRGAVRDRAKLWVHYRDEKGSETRRILWPLALAFYSPVWLLVAWCELREDFRTFRADRILALETLAARFASEPGKTLEDYLARLENGAR